MNPNAAAAIAQARAASTGTFPGSRGAGYGLPEAQSPVLDAWDRAIGIGWGTQVYSGATGLPRAFDTFREGQFGPFEPIWPVPIDRGELPSGRPRPRRWQFPVGWNLPVGQPGTEGLKLANFQILRDYAEIPSIPRNLIELTKADIEDLSWDIVPTTTAQFAMQGNPKKRKDWESRKDEVIQFFENPDPDNYNGYDEWLNSLLEDTLVLDALALYLHPSQGRGHGPCGSNVGALVIVDGSTVRPLLDDWGALPRPPNPAYQQCFSADTEVLTRRGWLLFSDLTYDDQLATRSADGKLKWQKPEHLIDQSYEGEMCHFTSRTLDLLVTPDHRMLVDHRPRALGGTGNRWHDEGETFVTAGELVELYEQPGRSTKSKAHSAQCSQARFTACAEWDAPDLELFVIPDDDWRGLGPTRLSGDNFAAFMGMWLAEGSLTHVHGELRSTVQVSQARGSKGYAAYRDLLERVVGDKLRYNGKSFIFAARRLAIWLERFGTASEKFIPEEIMEMSARQLRIFWDYYAMGDGRARDGAIVTVSRRMANQLQEVALKIGIAASVRPHSTPGAWVVSPHTTRWRGWNVETTWYSGRVVCASVPNGTLYIRRNGYVSFQGNCIWGVPRVDLMDIINLGPNADITDLKAINPILNELSTTGEEWEADQLLYVRQNPRSWTPYGFGPLEQAMLPASILLARQSWQWEFYRSGSLPQVFLDPGPTIANAQEARQLQEAINMMGGDMGAKHQVIVLPPGSKVDPQKPTDLSDQFDEWLAALLCMPFGYSISDLGLTPKISSLQSPAASMGAAQTATDRGTQHAILPRIKKLKRQVFDRVIQKLIGQEDMEWSWGIVERGETKDQLVRRSVELFKSSIGSLDEVRIALEWEPLGYKGISDVPLVFTGQGAIPITSISDVQQAQLQQLQAQTQATLAAPSAATGSNGTSETGKTTGPPKKGTSPKQTTAGPPRRAARKPAALPAPKSPTVGSTVPLEEAARAAEATPNENPQARTRKSAIDEELAVLRRFLKNGRKIEKFEPNVLAKSSLEAAYSNNGNIEDIITDIRDAEMRGGRFTREYDHLAQPNRESEVEDIADLAAEEAHLPMRTGTKDFSVGSPLSSGFVPFDLVGPERPRKKRRRKKVLPSHSNPEGETIIDPTIHETKSASSAALAEPRVVAAGIAVRAEDTGRVLLLQRSVDDDSDPARGKWEAAGGHVENGETPFVGARREWEEEIGSRLPPGRVVGMWESPNGIYQGFVYSVPTEDSVDINLDYPRVENPDAPLHAKPETAAWFDITELNGMPALRSELQQDLPLVLAELRKPVRLDAGDARPKATKVRVWTEKQHPRGQPSNAGEFTTARATRTSAGTKPHPGMHPATAQEIQQLRNGTHKSGVKLVIPPAWTDVHLSNDLNHVGLQAKGVDSKGRVQPLYHPEYRKQQDDIKFQRVKALQDHLDKIDAYLRKNAATDDTAGALMLSRKLGVRNGSERNTGSDQSAYAATTLQRRHVRLYPGTGRVTLDFIGKAHKRSLLTTTDPDVYKMMAARLKKPGNPSDQLFPAANEKKTNALLDELTGTRGFKVHDLRTNHANVVALKMVGNVRRKPSSKTAFAKIRNGVADEVAKQLGDTRTVALKSYINPAVFKPLWNDAWGEMP